MCLSRPQAGRSPKSPGDSGWVRKSLRSWYRQAEVDRGEGRPGELTSAEGEELERLRKRNAEQAETIEVL